MDHAEKAQELFLQGYNCSQSVFLAFEDLTGLDQPTGARLSSSFGGGMGRLREVCGAVSGMVLVANFVCGQSDISDKAAKDAHYAKVRELTDAFQKETGSVVCRELLGLKEKQSDEPVSEARTEQYYKKRPCAELVALAAEIVDKTLFC
jgi:C_GCAxxG_C_C family probable redox protein